MNLSWKKNDGKSKAADAAKANTTNVGDITTGTTTSSGVKGTALGSQQPGKEHSDVFTSKEGCPTPKCNRVEREYGVHRGSVKAPLTAKEAHQCRKELKASMSEEKLKAAKARERTERREQCHIADECMTVGGLRYALPRDQGAERKFARDRVDSHRFLANMLLPFALTLLLIMIIGASLSRLANIVFLIAMVLIIALIIEGIYIGCRTIKLTRERFPKTTKGAWGLSFCVYPRAFQPRHLRAPCPQVSIGDEIRWPHPPYAF